MGAIGAADERHVLVLALSTFPGNRSENKDEQNKIELKKVTYVYKDRPENKAREEEGKEGEEISLEGYYQLDPIPLFIQRVLGDYVTDVVMLETKETINNPKTIVNQEPEISFLTEKNEWTPREYFQCRIKKIFGEDVKFHDLEIDEMNAAGALRQVMETIRKIYETVEDKSRWRLWMDTHGGFRDISMVLVSAARFFATDKNQPIDTDGIFSVYHSQDPKIADRIINQTAFYFADSADALQNFLNYGQYLAVRFRPYEGDNKYAFISYRHDEKLLVSVRNLFARFTKNGILYWYDDGIRYRDNWREKLEYENKCADIFIGLLSQSYFESVECWKELIRAIAFKKNGEIRCNSSGRAEQFPENITDKGDVHIWDKFHFVLLEDMKVLPNGLPKHMPEILALGEELQVSDEDICDCLNGGGSQQMFQWFKYMRDGSTIDPKNLEDPEIDAGIRKIGELLR